MFSLQNLVIDLFIQSHILVDITNIQTYFRLVKMRIFQYFDNTHAGSCHPKLIYIFSESPLNSASSIVLLIQIKVERK